MKIVKLIKLEISKYKDNSLVQMLLLFFTILTPTSIFVLKIIGNIPFLPGKEDFFSFPMIWEYQAYFGNWLAFFFLGYFGVFIITSEIQFKTMRQNIITGMSRNDFFIGKISFSLLVSVYATLIFYVSTALIGLYNQESLNLLQVFNGQDYIILRFLLMTFAYISFGMMIGYIVKKPGLATFFYFSYILFIELILRWWAHANLIGKSKSILYYPMNAIEDLTPLPFYKYVENFNPIEDLPNIVLSHQEAIIISIISIAFFLGFSHFIFHKKDI